MALDACKTVTDAQGRELMDHGTTLFPVGCYHDDLEEHGVPWHWHGELEAVVVEQGTVTASVGGESRALGPGEGFFVNSEVLHGAWRAASGPCRLHSLVFHPRLVGGSLDSIFYQGYVQPLLSDTFSCGVWWLDGSAPWHREALDAIEAGWQSCVAEPAGYEFLVREALSRLVVLLVGNRPAMRKRPSEKTLRDAARIKTMLQYIEAHLGEELTTARIARCAAISESECLRCFRAMVGSTPIRYVKELRIQRAAELLAATDRKIADIGAMCGFQEMSYFAKSFREIKGCRPLEYRRKKQRQQAFEHGCGEG